MYRDPRFQRVEVRPVTGAIGAEIVGVDLASRPDDAIFEEVRRALHVYKALSIRDQKLDPQSLHEVARRFGPFSGNPVHIPVEGFDDIVRFVREPDETGKVIGEDWHMDLAWMEKPPGITMLYGEVIPPVGGDTFFASLEHAYDYLSDGMKALIAGLVGVHCGKGVFANNAAHKHLGVRADATSVDDIETEHPLVCAHPHTGRLYIFVSGVLRRFKGMTEAESKPIIDYLISVATRPEFTCRLRWQQGTLTMWDNPHVLHTAINDYSGYRRVTYRTTVEGQVPQAASARRPVSMAA
jgi:taurine dioxygenase